MSDYKEELSALVEKIRQDGAKEERRRIVEKLERKDFCVFKSECRGASPENCLEHIYEWLDADNV